MPAHAASERQSAVLIVAAPRSDWAPVAEHHTSEEKNVVVLFAHEQGPSLVAAVRDRIRSLTAGRAGLVAIACVGILDLDALGEVALAAGLPIL